MLGKKIQIFLWFLPSWTCRSTNVITIIMIYFLEKREKEWQTGIKYLNAAKYIL